MAVLEDALLYSISGDGAESNFVGEIMSIVLMLILVEEKNPTDYLTQKSVVCAFEMFLLLHFQAQVTMSCLERWGRFSEEV